MSDFFEMVRKFLLVYLPDQRCLSENTIRSYRQTLNLFVTYLSTVKGFAIPKIQFSIIDKDTILSFLAWLEESRHCGAGTRNQRLAALRSFFNYAGKNDCTQADLYLKSSEIPLKKAKGKVVEFLSEEELTVLLRQPNLSKPKGIRDMVLLTMMYDTAARCNEILELKVRDLRLDNSKPTAILHGKGSKPRTIPLMSRTVTHCRKYLAKFHPDGSVDEYMFYTVIHGEHHKMSEDNVEKMIAKYGKMGESSCPEMHKHIFPHMLRHTRAMHLYRNGMPLNLLSQFLGHSNEETTRIYAYADTEMKRKAMEKADSHRRGAEQATEIWDGDEEMILKLSGLR